MLNKTQTTYSDLKQLLDTPGTPEPVLRDRFQAYFDAIVPGTADAAGEKAFSKGLCLLRQYYNRVLPEETATAVLDLADLCETLSFCCDLLCGAHGKRIFCSADAPLPAVCVPRAVSWALLNLLSNAILYASGKYIFVFLQETEKSIVLRVSNEGVFPQKLFASATQKAGSGLCCAARIARAHGGCLLCLSKTCCTTLALTFPKQPTAGCPLCPPDSFLDLLSDRLSLLYAALSGVCPLHF